MDSITHSFTSIQTRLREQFSQKDSTPSASRTRLPYRLSMDWLIALCLLAIGFGVGVLDVSRWNVKGNFYQPFFEAAAMSACGKGFVEPVRPIPALKNSWTPRTVPFWILAIPSRAQTYQQISRQSLQRHMQNSTATCSW